MRGSYTRENSGKMHGDISTLEIIFCAFLAENYFVKVLIPFIGVRLSAILFGGLG